MLLVTIVVSREAKSRQIQSAQSRPPELSVPLTHHLYLRTHTAAHATATQMRNSFIVMLLLLPLVGAQNTSCGAQIYEPVSRAAAAAFAIRAGQHRFKNLGSNHPKSLKTGRAPEIEIDRRDAAKIANDRVQLRRHVLAYTTRWVAQGVESCV